MTRREDDMSISLKESGICYLAVTLAVIILDYLSKTWIIDSMEPYSAEAAISVIDGFFRIIHVHNHGAAFSFLADYPGWQKWLFSSIAVLVSLFLVYLLRETPRQRWFLNTGYALVIGGALGNLYDRLVYGYVIDFLDFYVGMHHYPAFNIADCGVCTGVAVIMICEIFVRKPESENKPE